MKCVELIGRDTFDLDEVYAFEERLSALYPNNQHVKPKIRQQLQVLRDHGYLEFLSKGRYGFYPQDMVDLQTNRKGHGLVLEPLRVRSLRH
jgi:hypothetical protein